MAKCGACGTTGLRKTQLAAVIEKGKIVGKRIGACCSGDAILLVATKIAPILQSSERRTQKETLTPFVEILSANLKIRKGNFPTADGDDRYIFQGYIECLEDVLALLKAGRT